MTLFFFFFFFDEGSTCKVGEAYAWIVGVASVLILGSVFFTFFS
jgi:hypothetical protein